jgi:hypothetical protein
MQGLTRRIGGPSHRYTQRLHRNPNKTVNVSQSFVSLVYTHSGHGVPDLTSDDRPDNDGERSRGLRLRGSRCFATVPRLLKNRPGGRGTGTRSRAVYVHPSLFRAEFETCLYT